MPPTSTLLRSHPMWVRGLKLAYRSVIGIGNEVAPYVGAWIETVNDGRAALRSGVAPYVGAWIETLFFGNARGKLGRRTLCGCVD